MCDSAVLVGMAAIVVGRMASFVGIAHSAFAYILPLSLTYSRTGFAVAAIEVLMWAVLSGRRKVALAFVAVLATVAVAGGVAMRFHPDTAAMNRLLIWWSGLKLSTANPAGVGMGNSGLLVSAFMLDGIECRTLVNSHLTLLAELGWIVGGAWLAFVLSGIFGGVGRLRTWCAFAGLSLSAFTSSVFDWHVLLGVVDIHSHSNLLLSWGLFVLYVGCGLMLVLRPWPLCRMFSNSSMKRPNPVALSRAYLRDFPALTM